MTRFTLTISLAAALALAACAGSSSSPSSSAPQGLQVTRGAVTSRSAGALTVNGIQLSTSSASVRVDGGAATEDRLAKGMVVTVRGAFDDRGGHASEIEVHHGLEGQIDDKGTDFVVIGGQRVHVDDSTEFEAHHPGRLDDLAVGSVIAVSGVPDDKGGLRASRIDDSSRQAGPTASRDDLDIKGFVSNVIAGTSFELRVTPDASARYLVTTAGLTLPAGLKDGSIVEVHSLSRPVSGTPPVIATITASSVALEDRLGGAHVEVEIEGIVTSGTSSTFVIDGTTVVTDASTRWSLGAPSDLVPGVKVEAEGSLDDGGALQARKVSFRAGARISAVLQDVSWNGTSGSATLLGVPVQLPSFARYDVTPANGVRVEARGNPSASGTGIVALRISPESSGGSSDRVFVRGVATAKGNANAAAPTFTILGFGVTTAGARFRAVDDSLITADAFFAAVEAGHTVVKVRAAASTDVSGTSFAADELELEGDE